MADFGQNVSWLGHSVGTSGQVVAPVVAGQRVCWPEQVVRVPAALQMVAWNGHCVGFFGHSVWLTGHTVTASLVGQMVS